MRKKIISIFLIVIFVVALAGCVFSLRALVNYESQSDHEQVRIETISRAEKTVVAVKTDSGHGSGIIYKKENLPNNEKRYSIITNHHVVEFGGEMSIYFGSSEDEIKVVDYASFAPQDIAVVRIITTKELNVHNSPVINENKRMELIKGQDVIAIGSPYSLELFNYVTTGIVSLTHRSYLGIDALTFMHDASLNPGNSGGPLFNLNGDLIGINVAKVATVNTQTGLIAAEGLGYALNINTIALTINSFIESDYIPAIARGRLGVTVMEVAGFILVHDPDLIKEDQDGVVVVDVDPTMGSYGKLEIYDLVTKINDKDITNLNDIRRELSGTKAGDAVSLTVIRKQGSEFVELEFDITLS